MNELQDFIINKFYKKATDGVFIEINAGAKSYTEIFEKEYRWVGLCTEKNLDLFKNISNRKCCVFNVDVDGDKVSLSGIVDSSCFGRMVHFLCINKTSNAELIIKDFYKREIFDYLNAHSLYWVRRVVSIAVDISEIDSTGIKEFLTNEGEMTYVNKIENHEVYVHKIYDILI